MNTTTTATASTATTTTPTTTYSIILLDKDGIETDRIGGYDSPELAQKYCSELAGVTDTVILSEYEDSTGEPVESFYEGVCDDSDGDSDDEDSGDDCDDDDSVEGEPYGFTLWITTLREGKYEGIISSDVRGVYDLSITAEGEGVIHTSTSRINAGELKDEFYSFVGVEEVHHWHW